MSDQRILTSLPHSVLDGVDNVPAFVGLLNDSFKILYQKEIEPFKVSAINYYAFHCKSRYIAFDIQKKNGGLRPINAPIPYLKLIQRCVNLILQNQFKPHHTSHGFLLNRSIVSNAKKHVRRRFVLNIDIENFFGSIGFRRVKTVLGLAPFNLKEGREGIAFLLSNLCCNNGVLPQGGPCSPILTNVVCQRLDRKLFQFARHNRAIYTRYADDISFSSNHSVFTDSFKVQVEEIIKGEGFKINESKTRLQSHTQSQVVTGITVNEKLNVDRAFIRKIRAILNNYSKHGYDYAQQKFEKSWNKPGTKPPHFINSLHGQIEYLGMIRGKSDSVYQKYKKLFLDSFDDPIDFSFVANENVRHQLIRDYSKMGRIKEDLSLNEDERFSEYCINAFLQIEELINYYFISAMSFDRFLEELSNHTFLDKGRTKGKSNVGQVEMVYKTYLFEKYFYYSKGLYYDSVINKIRLVRNEGLHRCSAIIKDEKKILTLHQELQERIKAYQLLNKEEYRLTNREKHLEYEIKLIPFLKERNYKVVKRTISDVALKIRDALKKI